MSADYPVRRLPKQPDLEQLRTQAKELLKAYRAGDPAATGEVGRFEHRPDPGAFALNDAQRSGSLAALAYSAWNASSLP